MIKKQKGFTLIEMLIVLLIISVLILITIPNVSKHFASIDEKGCSAYMKMVQGQVEAYKIDEQSLPSLSDLVSKGYLKETETTCPNGQQVTVEEDGTVVVIAPKADEGDDE